MARKDLIDKHGNANVKRYRELLADYYKSQFARANGVSLGNLDPRNEVYFFMDKNNELLQYVNKSLELARSGDKQGFAKLVNDWENRKERTFFVRNDTDEDLMTDYGASEFDPAVYDYEAHACRTMSITPYLKSLQWSVVDGNRPADISRFENFASDFSASMCMAVDDFANSEQIKKQPGTASVPFLDVSKRDIPDNAYGVVISEEQKRKIGMHHDLIDVLSYSMQTRSHKLPSAPINATVVVNHGGNSYVNISVTDKERNPDGMLTDLTMQYNERNELRIKYYNHYLTPDGSSRLSSKDPMLIEDITKKTETETFSAVPRDFDNIIRTAKWVGNFVPDYKRTMLNARQQPFYSSITFDKEQTVDVQRESFVMNETDKNAVEAAKVKKSSAEAVDDKTNNIQERGIGMGEANGKKKVISIVTKNWGGYDRRGLRYDNIPEENRACICEYTSIAADMIRENPDACVGTYVDPDGNPIGVKVFVPDATLCIEHNQNFNPNEQQLGNNVPYQIHVYTQKSSISEMRDIKQYPENVRSLVNIASHRRATFVNDVDKNVADRRFTYEADDISVVKENSEYYLKSKANTQVYGTGSAKNDLHDLAMRKRCLDAVANMRISYDVDFVAATDTSIERKGYYRDTYSKVKPVVNIYTRNSDGTSEEMSYRCNDDLQLEESSGYKKPRDLAMRRACENIEKWNEESAARAVDDKTNNISKGDAIMAKKSTKTKAPEVEVPSLDVADMSEPEVKADAGKTKGTYAYVNGAYGKITYMAGDKENGYKPVEDAKDAKFAVANMQYGENQFADVRVPVAKGRAVGLKYNSKPNEKGFCSFNVELPTEEVDGKPCFKNVRISTKNAETGKWEKSDMQSISVEDFNAQIDANRKAHTSEKKAPEAEAKTVEAAAPEAEAPAAEAKTPYPADKAKADKNEFFGSDKNPGVRTRIAEQCPDMSVRVCETSDGRPFINITAKGEDGKAVKGADNIRITTNEKGGLNVEAYTTGEDGKKHRTFITKDNNAIESLPDSLKSAAQVSVAESSRVFAKNDGMAKRAEMAASVPGPSKAALESGYEKVSEQDPELPV